MIRHLVYKSALDPAFLGKVYDPAIYPAKDYHTLYILLQRSDWKNCAAS
jgi:hypothetical protein